MPVTETLLAELRDFPTILHARARAIAPAKWTQRSASGEFALIEHACHLRDFEIDACQDRIRRMLAETEPTLADFDGEAVADARDYRAQDAERALREFEQARAATVESLATLSGELLARTARMAPHGVITIARLAELMAEHDASHRAELDRLVTELR